LTGEDLIVAASAVGLVLIALIVLALLFGRRKKPQKAARGAPGAVALRPDRDVLRAEFAIAMRAVEARAEALAETVRALKIENARLATRTGVAEALPADAEEDARVAALEAALAETKAALEAARAEGGGTVMLAPPPAAEAAERIGKLEETLARLHQELAGAHNEVARRDALIAERDRAIEAKNAELRAAERALAERQAEIAARAAELSARELALDARAAERAARPADDQAAMHAAVKEAEAALAAAHEEIHERRIEAATAAVRADAVAAELAELKDGLAAGADLDELKARLAALAATVVATAARLQGEGGDIDKAIEAAARREESGAAGRSTAHPTLAERIRAARRQTA
jgi:DNA repair exonuclease SbcCD ATPase subunit